MQLRFNDSIYQLIARPNSILSKEAGACNNTPSFGSLQQQNHSEVSTERTECLPECLRRTSPILSNSLLSGIASSIEPHSIMPARYTEDNQTAMKASQGQARVGACKRVIANGVGVCEEVNNTNNARAWSLDYLLHTSISPFATILPQRLLLFAKCHPPSSRLPRRKTTRPAKLVAAALKMATRSSLMKYL